MLDYTTYQDRGGVLTEADFNKYRDQATSYLEYITMGKSSGVLNEYQTKKVDDAVFYLIDWFSCDDASKSHDDIASESVGQHSISYQKKESKEKAKEKMQIANEHLSMTGLLYGGLHRGGIE